MRFSHKPLHHTMRANHPTMHFRNAKSALCARLTLMLQNKMPENASCISFTDLPAEIHDMIYHLALFEPLQGEYAETGKWTLSTKEMRHGRFPPVRSQAYEKELVLAELRQDRTLSVLKTLGTMNKQIRREVQAFF
jgi:hypothetical protein